MYASPPVKSRLPRQHRRPLPQTGFGHPECACHNGGTTSISKLRRIVRKTERAVSGREDRDVPADDTAAAENRKSDRRRDDAAWDDGARHAGCGRGRGASAESGVITVQSM